MKVLLISVVVIGVAMVIIDCATLQPKTRHSSDYDEHTCPRRCSEAYNPLCGINQGGETKVFVNDCYMSMENCMQLAQQVYHQTHESDCADFEEWINEDDFRKKLNI